MKTPLKCPYKNVVPRDTQFHIVKDLGIKPIDKSQNGYNKHGYKLDQVCGPISLSSEQAYDLLANHKYINNRKIDESWVAELMVCNQRDSEVALCYIVSEDRWVIVNGHHNLLAAINRKQED